MSEHERIYVGIDWGSKQHQVCVLGPQGQRRAERSVEHSGEGLRALCQWLAGWSSGGGEVHAALETPHGPVVETLLAHGVSVYSLNPKQLDRFRDRLSPAGAKDDRKDAQVLAWALRTDRDAFRKVDPEEPAVVQLREWSRIAEELTQERVRLSQQLREQLQRYYPQMLQLDSDPTKAWIAELFQLAPTPRKAQKLSGAQIQPLLRRHRVRRLDAKQVRKILRQRRLQVSQATAQAAQAHIQTLLPRVAPVREQLRLAEKKLDQCTDAWGEESEGEPHDVQILRSLPGLGRICIAVLLSEGHPVLSRRDYHALRTWAGVAPVTIQTGRRAQGPRRHGRVVVRMRRACHQRLRNAVFHWARVAVQRDPRARARYAALRARGKPHTQSLRVVADGLLRTACAMLRNRTLYRPPPQLEPIVA